MAPEVVPVTQVLVAFASRHGSTREVAAALADRLRRDGLDVELHAARDVRSPVTGHDLVVLGAPLYSGRWHRDAHRFLRRRRADLAATPIAVFGMGPRNDSAESWRRARAQLDRALARHAWLVPVAVMVFGGADPPKARPPRRDLRDWDAVGAWASGLPALLVAPAGAATPATVATDEAAAGGAAPAADDDRPAQRATSGGVTKP